MAERTIGSPANIATGKLSVSGTAVKVVDARSGRRKLLITWSGDRFTLFLGNSSGLTTSNGFSVLANGNESIQSALDTESEVWAISSTSGSLSFMEIYD